MPKKVYKTPPSAASNAASASAPNARRERRRPFNREYQRRAARLALSRAACTLLEDANSGFYRPSRLATEILLKPKPVTKKDTGQLSLEFVADPMYDLWHDPEEIS